jgi:hypothetical protein
MLWRKWSLSVSKFGGHLMGREFGLKIYLFDKATKENFENTKYSISNLIPLTTWPDPHA